MKKKVVTLLIISALLVSCSTSEQKPETLQEEPEATLIDGTLAEWCMLFELPLYGYVEEV